MLIIRKVLASDKEALFLVESESMPKHRYLPQVFELFLSDQKGEFMLAELEGEVVACAKFTVLADGSAWLETLRVIPRVQGQGIGKKFYQRFFELAKENNVPTMRMYTGVNNRVSKGLAESVGFSLEEQFLEFKKDCGLIASEQNHSLHKHSFQQVTDIKLAIDMILPKAEQWKHFAVMNRTFYKITAEQCAEFVEKGQVYVEAESDSIVVCGARFMPEQALHIAFFTGDAKRCLRFAEQKALDECEAKQLSCFVSVDVDERTSDLVKGGFQKTPTSFVVMKVS